MKFSMNYPPAVHMAREVLAESCLEPENHEENILGLASDYGAILSGKF